MESKIYIVFYWCTPDTWPLFIHFACWVSEPDPGQSALTCLCGQPPSSWFCQPGFMLKWSASGTVLRAVPLTWSLPKKCSGNWFCFTCVLLPAAQVWLSFLLSPSVYFYWHSSALKSEFYPSVTLLLHNLLLKRKRKWLTNNWLFFTYHFQNFQKCYKSLQSYIEFFFLFFCAIH